MKKSVRQLSGIDILIVALPGGDSVDASVDIPVI
jgi:hypothetical protein